MTWSSEPCRQVRMRLRSWNKCVQKPWGREVLVSQERLRDPWLPREAEKCAEAVEGGRLCEALLGLVRNLASAKLAPIRRSWAEEWHACFIFLLVPCNCCMENSQGQGQKQGAPLGGGVALRWACRGGPPSSLWPAWHPWMVAGLLFQTIKNTKDESSKLGGSRLLLE